MQNWTVNLVESCIQPSMPGRLSPAAVVAQSGIERRTREPQVLVTGGEDGSLTAWDVRANAPALSVARAHAARIRGVAPLAAPAPDQGLGSGSGGWAVGAASSDGVVRVWDLRRASAAGSGGSGAAAGSGSGTGWLAEAATGARLTCLCAASLPGPGPGDRAGSAGARAPAAVPSASAAAAPAAQPKRKKRRLVDNAPGQQAARADTIAETRAARGSSGVSARGRAGGDSPAAARQKGKAQRVAPAPAAASAGAAAGARPVKGGGGKPKDSPQSWAADDGVRVHDGVVEFLDPPKQKAGSKQKKKARLHAKAAAFGLNPPRRALGL